MTRPAHRHTTAGLLGLCLVAGAVALAPIGATNAASSKALNGTFKLTKGSYSNGKPHGTYFRMSNSGGLFHNPDSTASNKTYTLGTPGTDGGLATGRFQPHPDPPFDSKGNALAKKILRPQAFTSIRFSVVTIKQQKGSSDTASVTTARVSGRKLTVSLPGFTAEWNKQYFNQGAPKPDGSGSPATGTYNAKTKRFAFEWRSKVSGGPFNGFTGFWHFEGKFRPR
ncbi:MAG: hypothetical protein QOG42_920 [Solirubrobacteraceae bacterium]|jgi:hypothetical protein|nr:hypothetical protein [Solirubrobacteraceae bacterium]